ncbi:MAG: 5-formyltetrahydrofolate cyclo-ligase [SAR324 cluster bacterium]|nr:5-formyltetrahydrofolate cyclo-ligase [SAR324 cluster bacterium]
MIRDPAAEKASLRAQVLASRNAMGEAKRLAASRRIVELLTAQPAFQQAKGVHCFVSLPGEVETEDVFAACWEAGKKAYIPYQIRSEGRLGWSCREPEDRLVNGPFSVPEPAPDNLRPAKLEEIDLVLVPGVAFDRQGNRLGYGKGYYDTFLTLFAQKYIKRNNIGTAAGLGNAAMIGLAFAVQIVPSVPRESWDIVIGQIITEMEVIGEPRGAWKSGA